MTYPIERWEAVRDWILPLRLNAGLSQKELAAKAGLSPETIRPFTNGIPAVRDQTSAAKVCIALGAPGDSIQRILEGAEPPGVPDEIDERFRWLEETLRAQAAQIARIEQHLDLDGR